MALASAKENAPCLANSGQAGRHLGTGPPSSVLPEVSVLVSHVWVGTGTSGNLPWALLGG